ncbi:hypothetical protein ACWC0A_30575 [Streptomyces scopuliridis]
MDYELIEDDERDQYPVAPFLDFARKQPRPEPEPETTDVAT